MAVFPLYAESTGGGKMVPWYNTSYHFMTFFESDTFGLSATDDPGKLGNRVVLTGVSFYRIVLTGQRLFSVVLTGQCFYRGALIGQCFSGMYDTGSGSLRGSQIHVRFENI